MFVLVLYRFLDGREGNRVTTHTCDIAFIVKDHAYAVGADGSVEHTAGQVYAIRAAVWGSRHELQSHQRMRFFCRDSFMPSMCLASN